MEVYNTYDKTVFLVWTIFETVVSHVQIVASRSDIYTYDKPVHLILVRKIWPYARPLTVIWTDMGLVRVRINPLMKTWNFHDPPPHREVVRSLLVSPPKHMFAAIDAWRSTAIVNLPTRGALSVKYVKYVIYRAFTPPNIYFAWICRLL